MDRIHYAGDSCATGTDIARALLDYAQALAQTGGSATVDVPTINDDGSRGRSQFLVGPSSQLISSAEASTYDELIDEELVAFLRGEASRLRMYGPAAPSAELADADQPEAWTEYGV
ncbi:hypothetical protein LQ938_03495 [Microbacterium sp. cx-55]|uniref:hypothetical protein n=1 Tax=unclassified Microbacterium TaxID=2609290 RepID=UPI001CBFABB8|nr:MULTISPECIES: hypothetical protein [unclassified Microbacterium]MBZ4486955.1 hypothetical protein [Microbacterium sp. cx-55]MCC4907978.1 hypothetical protein [Microbacterium sp. cx-59]UGB35874.1 hypothetical protein LQ938_03495 [Microbacterium sp. cx-55]